MNDAEKVNKLPEPTTPKQVLLEVLFLGIALGAVGLFAQNTPVMSVIIGVNIIARFALIGRKMDWKFFLIGVVFGGGNDIASMAKDVYYYTPPTILPVPIPVWMVIFWGHIFLGFRHLFQLPTFQGKPIEGNRWKVDKRLIADILTAVVLRVIIYNFVQQEPIPTIGFASVIALRLIVVPPKKHEWLLMATVITGGALFEWGLISFGLYVYHDPVFLLMPAWLLMYWLFAIPLLAKGIFDRIEAGGR